MKPPPFRYERARSVEDAVELLASGGTVLAGGQSLVAQMALRSARPELLVDVNDLEELRRHEFPSENHGAVVLGATCRQETLAQWAPGDRKWRAVPQAARAVGNYVIRVRGTVGGSIAHADPAAELPLIFLMFDGELTTRSVSGERLLKGSRVFAGPQRTAVLRDELITDLRLLPPPAGAITVFRELSERIAIVGVGVGLAVRDARCTWCRVALCGVGPTPIRAGEAEQRLLGSSLATSDVEEAAQLAATECAPSSDTHGSARFRRALVAALVRSNVSDIMRQPNVNTG